MSYLIEKGERQNWRDGWTKVRYIVTAEPMERHPVWELTGVTKIFEDDPTQIKFQKFAKECDDARILCAFEDLIDDLKSGKISVNDDWLAYSNPKNFFIFEDGAIRWGTK